MRSGWPRRGAGRRSRDFSLRVLSGLGECRSLSSRLDEMHALLMQSGQAVRDLDRR